MPQGDLETLVSACASGSTDRKIACETLADTMDQPERNPDSPPESFWLSGDAEFDWWDRNAVYERKESTKGNSISTNLNPSFNSNSSSQRFCKNFKSSKAATLIGLPKPQKTSFVDAKNRRNHKQGNTRLFPKRSASVAKSESTMIEPSSPKVSCIGRVRSKRDRSRRLRNRQRSTSDSVKAITREKSGRTGRRKPGFFESFRAIFRSRRQQNKAEKSETTLGDSTSKSKPNRKARGSPASKDDASFVESVPGNSVSESEPPALGGINRFASGRRSESWGVGDSEIHVAQ